MAALEDDEYEIPLRDQRVFGAGLKRKRIQFVSSTSTESPPQSLPATPSQTVAERYLATVLKKPRPAERSESEPAQVVAPKANSEDVQASNEETALKSNPQAVCDICHHAMNSTDQTALHETSLTHQICLAHSHPPSHIDRRRHGLAVLSTQGWDPDSRRGLGVDGEGRLYPIKAKENPNRAGLGMSVEALKVKEREKPVKLDAGKVRLGEAEERKKAQKLREAFYRSEDVERYLGGEGEVNEGLDLAAFRRAKRR